MANAKDADPILRVAAELAARGVACHWLRPKSKAPVEAAWSKAPVYSPDELRDRHQPGFNLGVRPGLPSKVGDYYLHLFDLDIRRPEFADTAWAALLELLPEARDFPTVASGSGGESRHIYFLCDAPLRSRKIARSGTQSPGADGKPKDDWSLTLYGTGLQAVLPPSTHPSGKPYRWIKPIPWDLVDLGLGPIVPAERANAWAGRAPDDNTDQADDDLLSLARSRPLDISDEEIDGVLDDLPLDAWCEDRDGWLQVGMALHHQYGGDETGYEKWCRFSEQSAKFDPDDQRRVWESFRNTPNPVRFATLLKVAKDIRAERQYDFEAIDDDGGDLFDQLVGEADGEDDNSWRQQLDKTSEGLIKPTVSNLSLIVQFDPRLRGCCEFNELTQEVVTRKPIRTTLQAMAPLAVRDPVNGDLWQDQHDRNLRILLESARGKGKRGYGFQKVPDRDIAAAVDVAARRRAFHPVREYLETLTWDGRERMDRLFVDYLGAPDTPYTREIARLTLLGAVVRVYEPGHKFDFVPIIEGPQGVRKSTFIRILGRHWAAELDGDFSDRKRLVEQMQGAWILELPELSGFARSEIQAIKAFVSAPVDKVRLSYARRAAEFPRQCVFIGSTNDAEYLKDHTGGRRFWPVLCEAAEIDTDRLAGEVDQVWAEALAAYQALREKQPWGTLPLYLTGREAQTEAMEMQESRRIEVAEDAWAGEIHEWLDQPLTAAEVAERSFGVPFPDLDKDEGLLFIRNDVCLREIWTDCLGGELKTYNALTAAQLGRAMRRIGGWEAVGPVRIPRLGVQKVWRRVGAPASRFIRYV